MYRLVLGEILLQRTRAETVAAFYDQFFNRFPGWDDLARASLEEIEESLKPIGMWRQRAERLKALAIAVQTRGGKLPGGRAELEKLPGFGQYVTNATLLLSGRKKEPLLDAGMARVIERNLGPRKLADIRDDPFLQAAARLVVDNEQAVETNWAILDIAAIFCRSTRPACKDCPLVADCRHAIRYSIQQKG